MIIKTNQNSALNKTIYFASITIIIAGVIAIKSILIPILLALFLSIICFQPIQYLEKKKVPYTLALTIVLISTAIILFIFGGIIGNSISDFIVDIPFYDKKLREIFVHIYQGLNISSSTLNTDQLFEVIDPGKFLSFTALAAGEIGKVFSDYFLIIFIMIFMLLEVKIFILKIELIEKVFGKSLLFLNDIGVSIRHYLSIKTYVSLVTGLLIWLWLVVLGVDYAILWGLIAFLLNYIPNIGSLLAAIPTMLFSLIQLGVEGMVWTGLCYLVINTFMGNIVEPKVMGKGLGLSTLVVFLALIFWGFILGPVGMFLSIPLTITIKIILEQNKKTQWLAVLLSTEKETKQMLKDV